MSKLTHVMHTKISKKTFEALKARADQAEVDVSAYVRLLVLSHLEAPGKLTVLHGGDKVTRKEKHHSITASLRRKTA